MGWPFCRVWMDDSNIPWSFLKSGLLEFPVKNEYIVWLFCEVAHSLSGFALGGISRKWYIVFKGDIQMPKMQHLIFIMDACLTPEMKNGLEIIKETCYMDKRNIFITHKTVMTKVTKIVLTNPRIINKIFVKSFSTNTFASNLVQIFQNTYFFINW